MSGVEPAASVRRRRGRLVVAAVVLVVVVGSIVGSVVGPQRPDGSNAATAAVVVVGASSATTPALASLAVGCARCHAAIVQSWSHSHHAQAERAFGSDVDARPPGVPTTPVALIGVAPLQQAIVDVGRGRWQVFDPARDVRDGTWFSIHGDDVPAAGAWRHWTGGGLTWNAQCAACHTTGLDKAWDEGTDSYATTFRAHGVVCAACHGDVDAHAAGAAQPQVPHPSAEVCLSCHARREALTRRVVVDRNFDDQFRLLLADEPGLLFPDGRADDEAFEASSFLGSRMAHAGVTCLDCHEPHGGGVRRSIDDDALCLGCHTSPGSRGALVVDPATHTHHPVDSVGARCVSCHMPLRTFMARDARRDHAFASPDPRLAAELGMPDVCLSCHADRDAAWSTSTDAAWFGETASRARARERARVVAAAREGDPRVISGLVRAVTTERNDAWRAALVGLSRPFLKEPAVSSVVVSALHDPNARVRVAAVRVLTSSKEAHSSLLPLRVDGVRSVRIAAAWATRATPWTSALADEIEEWLARDADQPAGAIRKSERALVRAEPEEAIVWARRAVAKDPRAPALFALARALALGGHDEEARAVHARARAATTTSP